MSVKRKKWIIGIIHLEAIGADVKMAPNCTRLPTIIDRELQKRIVKTKEFWQMS
jgi:predicted TIM-barrel enzyme